MIGGYPAGQISLDDLASGFRNRTWAAITRDWAAKLGPARGAADDFEPVVAGRFDDVVRAYDRSASTSIGYAVLAQPPPAPAGEPAPASHGGTRRAAGRGRRLKTAVLAAQADPGLLAALAGQHAWSGSAWACGRTRHPVHLQDDGRKGKEVPRMGDDNKVHHEYERVVVSREGTTAREIRIYGSGSRLIFEGWQVADDRGQTAWISDAGAIAVFGQALYPGETPDGCRVAASRSHR